VTFRNAIRVGLRRRPATATEGLHLDRALHGATGTASGRGGPTRNPNRGAAAARLGLLFTLSDDYGAVRNSKTVDVRFGSKADIKAHQSDVRYSPKALLSPAIVARR
jgi:hypothetical protein